MNTTDLYACVTRLQERLQEVCAEAEVIRAAAYQFRNQRSQVHPIHGWFCDGFMWDQNVVWVEGENNAGD